MNSLTSLFLVLIHDSLEPHSVNLKQYAAVGEAGSEPMEIPPGQAPGLASTEKTCTKWIDLCSMTCPGGCCVDKCKQSGGIDAYCDLLKRALTFSACMCTYAKPCSPN
ncbi:hypothetical protein CTI12_AA011820 [Artemisia annua]|uniref:Uncharacterized protein n=1 Tax=Artemisia annua TaxID=35608 RepID=A0A2U1QLG4_ARTAN|nr:hypothetical protein CTI12_AA011820 [Artemisia annua]